MESITSYRKLRSFTITAPRHRAWSSAHEVLRTLSAGGHDIKMHFVADSDEDNYDDEPAMSIFGW